LLIYYPFEIDLSFLLGKLENGEANTVQFSDLFMISLAVVILAYMVITLINLAKEEIGKMLAALILILFSVLFWSFFEQGGGSFNFFAVGNVNSHGFNMTSVNNSINALWVVAFSPLVGLLWIWLAKRNLEPNTVVKFGLGFVFLGLGFLVFYVSKNFAGADGKTPLMLFCLAYLVITLGELCLSPIGLSMITKLSPKRLVGMMMGSWFLASAYGQYGAGIIGASLAESGSTENLSNLQKLEQYTQGYYTIGIIAVVAGVVLILISPLIKRLMREVEIAV
jgi:POT family proton-dependent oligopeptide transporter